ncbi:MAG: toprim domain-containing protein, partial [Bdellovibrionota bacterium]
DDQQPKYMNSNESFVFSKKNLLYGLHFAKSSIREFDQLILCEGNMDAIALFQYGFKQSVAIMGTAMNEFGLSHIRGLTKNMWLALDSDGPGQLAALRTANLLHKTGIMPKYLDFSPYKDPDELLKNGGPLALQKRIDEAPIFIDYLLTKEFPEKMPELIEQKQAVLLKVFALLAPLGDSLSANERLLTFAHKIGLRSDPQTIRQEFQGFLKGDVARIGSSTPINSQTAVKTPSHAHEYSPDSGVNLQTDLRPELKITKCHILMLRLLLENPLCLAQEKLKEVLDLLQSDEIKRYVGSLRDLFFEVEEAEFGDMALALLVEEQWPVSLKEVVGAILFDLGPKANGHKSRSRTLEERTLDVGIAELLLKDLAHRLEEEQHRLKRDSIKERQRNNETLEEANSSLLELNEVQKTLHQLNKKRRKTSQEKEL